MCLLCSKALFPSPNYSIHCLHYVWEVAQEKEKERKEANIPLYNNTGEYKYFERQELKWLLSSFLLFISLAFKKVRQPEADLTNWSNSFIFSFIAKISG